LCSEGKGEEQKGGGWKQGNSKDIGCVSFGSDLWKTRKDRSRPDLISILSMKEIPAKGGGGGGKEESLKKNFTMLLHLHEDSESAERGKERGDKPVDPIFKISERVKKGGEKEYAGWS